MGTLQPPCILYKLHHHMAVILNLDTCIKGMNSNIKIKTHKFDNDLTHCHFGSYKYYSSCCCEVYDSLFSVVSTRFVKCGLKKVGSH